MVNNDLEGIFEALNTLNNKIDYLYQQTLSKQFKPKKVLKLFDYMLEWVEIYKKPKLKNSSIYHIRGVKIL